MAELKKDSMNLVAIGRQNPQILNVDFLKVNEIVPLNKPPFKNLFQQEQPFTKFISTPVFTNLVLGSIEFTIDEQRFMVRDMEIIDWCDTSVLNIGAKYYEVLHHTPLKLVGINLTSKLIFTNTEEDRLFQKLFLPENSPLLNIVSQKDINASVVLRYPYPGNGDRVTLTFNACNKQTTERLINFNYEFDFNDLEGFKNRLSGISKVAKYCDNILNQLLKAI